MAALEIIALDEAVSELKAPPAGSTYVAKRAVHFEQALTTDSTIDGRDIAADAALLLTALQPGANISVLTNDSGYQANVALASQGEAEAGTENTKTMTALRVAQAIAILAAGIKNNYSATTNPATTNDASQGYTAGSVWINLTLDEAYRCVDPTTNLAVWVNTTLTTTELATVALSGSSDDLTQGVTKLLLTVAERAKLGFVTVTQAVDLDAIELAVAANVVAYAQISAQANVTAELTVDATPRSIAAWNVNGPYSGLTPDHTTNDLTIISAGTYIISSNVSFTGSNISTYRIEIYKNGVATGYACTRKMGTGADVGSVAVKGILNLVATDAITLYQSSTDGGTVLTVSEGQLIAHRVGS